MNGVEDSPLESHPQDSRSSIMQFFLALRQLLESTDSALQTWVSKRRQTICQLQQLSESLHNHYRNANIATATGAGVATASFGLVVGGFIASFFTFGAGFIVSAVGAGLGAAGGLTMTGSKLAEYILSQLETKEVQGALDEDREASEALRSSFERLDQFFACNVVLVRRNLKDPRLIEGFGIQATPAMFPAFVMDTSGNDQDKDIRDAATSLLRAITAGATVSASAATASVSAGRAIFSTLSAAARAAHIAGFAASALMLPIDIYFLVRSSLELHRGSTSEIVTKIKEDLAELTCPSDDEVPEMVKQYVRAKFLEVLHDLAEPKQVSTSEDG